jgi:methyltransferase family protein
MARLRTGGYRARVTRPLGMMRMFRVLLRENGFLWAFCFGAHWPLRRAAEAMERSLRELERRRQLPGVHTPDVQRELWQNDDWSRGGEEWTATEEWKRSVGPGAGRWTEELQKRARKLVLVDVSQSCIDACRSRFAGATNVEYNVNDGRTLPSSPTRASSLPGPSTCSSTSASRRRMPI